MAPVRRTSGCGTSDLVHNGLSFMEQGNRSMVQYVWLGGKGEYRCKTKVVDFLPKLAEDLPNWNYDGSSTNQAAGEDSEVLIKPRALFKDPFRGGDNFLVFCDTWHPNGTPIFNNTRVAAVKIFENPAVKSQEPWFGIEQEYTLFTGGRPLGWPKAEANSGFGGPCMQLGYPGPQGPYYCSVGADVNFGRNVADAHMKNCLIAGVKISGVNCEVMPGQWEYQVGPCTGIDSGDHMHISRFLLHRTAEDFGVVASLDPKPVPGDWNGAGCHTNVSTKDMRNDGGYKKIIEACEKLSLKHEEHIKVYGEGNERRLTGAHETASIDKFSYGVANRGASIRIPRDTEANGKGYFEDRRPSSNMDPYVVTSKIMHTCLL